MRKWYAITITGVLLLFQHTWTQNVGIFGLHIVACSRLVSNWDLFRKTCKSTPFSINRTSGSFEFRALVGLLNCLTLVSSGNR